MAKQMYFLLLLLTLGLFYSLIEAMYITPPCNDPSWYCRYKSRADECNKTDECFPPVPKNDVKVEKLYPPTNSDTVTSQYIFYNGIG
ncbi:hypothetical protein TSAR_005027 [Trichomalopsis sarcophagae]|uniref:Saposin A-type domain-containing protein n=1 Tax=Trichomalopsis sarcophagae TaxID=543379 RepID=A0A232FL97_9HYME|nr:hypothetical protein TSAR_005027 [Trichomalopsis sarcophagae]